MEPQMDELLVKYWNGTTNLEEEKVIKTYFKDNPTLNKESHYFRFIAKQKAISYVKKGGARNKKTWLSIAATITLGVITAGLVFNDAQKDPFAIEDPKEAFRATKEVLMMIGTELSQGQNHALALTKINKAKEEIQK